MLIASSHELGLYIKSRRQKLNLTQKALSELVGLQQKTISAIENAPDNVRVATLFKVMSAIECYMMLYPKDETPETTWDEEW